MPDRPLPKLVFTPRASEVNKSMYVPRQRLEFALYSAMLGDKNIIIHGESGCGKSWLYKRILDEYRVPFIQVNMANASRFSSIDEAIKDRVARIKKQLVVESSIDIKGGFSLPGFKFGAGAKELIKNLHPEPFEFMLELLSKAQDTTSERIGRFVIIENIESIVHEPKHVQDVASLIKLLDDPDYSIYGCRIILVGVPDNIQTYLKQTQNVQTITNRLTEVPEVERLSKSQAEGLLRKGFETILKQRFNKDNEYTFSTLAWHADYIPQYLHDIGYSIATSAMDQDEILDSDIVNGLRSWISSSFTSDSTAIEQSMNSKETRYGRRNQVVYTICNLPSKDFKSTDVETELRKFFPRSCSGKTLNVSQILAELSGENNSIIKRSPSLRNTFRFVSPTTRICGRLLLEVSNEKVSKKTAFWPRDHED